MVGYYTSLANLLFPRTCSACGDPLSEAGLFVCWDCRAKLSLISAPYCNTCGEPVHGRVDHAYCCHACSTTRPVYRHARAALHYNQAGRALVTGYKYNHAFWFEGLLVDLLEAAVRHHYAGFNHDLLAAVPLHPVKQRERGYNQSALLAKALSRRLNIPVAKSGWLKRIRPTPSQTRLTARQRLTNVRGAFKATRSANWNHKRVLLLDDVMTTGATVSECARILLDSGASSVDVITLARGV